MLEAMLRRLVKLRMFGKSPVGACLRLNEWTWNRLPRSVTSLGPFRSFGHLLHSLARLQDRRMYLGTFFLRNRPELELMRRLANRGSDGPAKIAVLGSSNGAEVYSIAWALRSAWPDARFDLPAVDISAESVEAGREGVYEPGVSELVDEPIFERMTAKEVEEMFERIGDRLRIKPWIREGIVWQGGDADDPRILETRGPQDIVVANRFLCHMRPLEAERCIRNIARLLVPGGFLFVSGVDLDVRAKVANDLGW